VVNPISPETTETWSWHWVRLDSEVSGIIGHQLLVETEVTHQIVFEDLWTVAEIAAVGAKTSFDIHASESSSITLC
jgi:hypothetical protein